jgi:hypothetical protein
MKTKKKKQKKASKVVMTKNAFVSEHKHLVKLLRNPNAKGLKKEAQEQSQELHKYL